MAPVQIGAHRPPDVKEIHIVWMTTGLSCDGDSVSTTAATLPSIEDVLLGAIPGLPKVHLHNPVLAYEVGDDFMQYWFQAAAGKLEALVRSPHLKKLTHLQLRLSDMGDAGCRAIVESGILRRLRWLDLRHGCISDEGARILADCPDLKTLEHLDLGRNALTAEGIARLEAVGIPSLRTDDQQTPEELAKGIYLYEGDNE